MVVVIPVLTILGLFGYFIKKEKFLLVTSIILYALIIPAFVVLGLFIGYFLMNIDYCAEVNKFTTTNNFPVAGKGLGYYTSCVSKENKVNLSTARYEISYSYDLTANDITRRCKDSNADLKLPANKRDNALLQASLETAMSYTSDQNMEQVVVGIKLLMLYNNVLAIIEPVFQCTAVKDIVTYVEDPMCYLTLTNIFEAMKYFFVAIWFLIPLAIGLNKLIVVLDPQFDKKKVRS